MKFINLSYMLFIFTTLFYLSLEEFFFIENDILDIGPEKETIHFMDNTLISIKNKETLKPFQNTIDYEWKFESFYKFYDHKNILKYLKTNNYIDSIKYGYKFYSSSNNMLTHDRHSMFVGSIPDNLKKQMQIASFDLISSNYTRERNTIDWREIKDTMGNIGFIYENKTKYIFNTSSYVSQGKQSRGIQNTPNIYVFDRFYISDFDYDRNGDHVLCMPDYLEIHFKDYIYRYLKQYLIKLGHDNPYYGINDVVYKLNEEGLKHFPNYLMNIGNYTFLSFFEEGLGGWGTCPFFLFGYGLFRKFDFVEFDYENNKLNLYKYLNNTKINISNYENIKDSLNSNNTVIRQFGFYRFEIVIIIIILISGIYLSCLRKNKIKKNEKVFNEYFEVEK